MTLLLLTAGEGPQDAECAWDDFDGLRPPVPCGEPAVCAVTDLCEHGHGRVFEARACARHAATTLDDKPGICGQCAEAGSDRHVVTVITLGGTVALAVEGKLASAAPGAPAPHRPPATVLTLPASGRRRSGDRAANERFTSRND